MSELTIGIVQYAPETTLEQNLVKFERFIDQAKSQGCRVVVFPEESLHGPSDTPRTEMDEAVGAVCALAAEHHIYIIFSHSYWPDGASEIQERLVVAGPDGKVVQIYDKLWGHPWFPKVPGPFLVDGTPCCAILCADRWIRGVEELPVFAGAQIIFECSYNSEIEWVPDLAYYWFVPRVLRNGSTPINRGSGY